MLADLFTYALRNLKKRRLRSWLTILGILIGIAAVVSLISLGQGLEDAITDQFSTLGANRITIQPQGAGFGPPGLGSAVTLTEDDRRVVERATGVSGAAGRILRPVTVEYNRRSRTQFLASLPEDRAQRAVVEQFLNPVPAQGRLLSPDDRGRIHIGSNFAEESRFGIPVEVGRQLTINGHRFTVVGILERTGTPQSDSSIIMNEQDVRRILNLTNEYSFIVAMTERAEDVSFVQEEITRDLRRSRGVREREEDFTVETSEDVLRTFQDILGIVTAVLAGIAAISLLVGGIGIMNTMYTAVVERTREIGVMKSIGATKKQIQTIFLIESGLLGLVGGIIGVLLGIGLAQLVELIAAQALGPNVLQASTPLWLILSALTFSFVTGMASGVFPAKRAAELPATEALR